MENNLENKAKFFAQYWGQEVIGDVNNAGQNVIYPVERSNMYRIEESHLALKPLSSITDQDAIEVVKMQGYLLLRDDLSPFFDLTTLEFSVCLYPKRNDTYEVVNIASVDYLRSKGYALPFLGLSVEGMVEYGWIKLTS